jgi:hypothetical protein
LIIGKSTRIPEPAGFHAIEEIHRHPLQHRDTGQIDEYVHAPHSMIVSSALADSSRASAYCIPEQPPPVSVWLSSF